MKIWKKLLQVERVHLEFTGNASRYIHIVYVKESSTYGVLFTSCLYENPNERVRAFDTNNERI